MVTNSNHTVEQYSSQSRRVSRVVSKKKYVATFSLGISVNRSSVTVKRCVTAVKMQKMQKMQAEKVWKVITAVFLKTQDNIIQQFIILLQYLQ